MINKYQVIIVGAGVVGLTSALAFCQKGFKVALVSQQLDQYAKNSFSEGAKVRVIALNQASINAYQNLDLWPLPDEAVAAYHIMEVWEKNSTAQVIFNAEQVGAQQLGAIVSNLALAKALYAKLKENVLCDFISDDAVKIENQQNTVWLQCGAQTIIQGDLLLAADGVNSPIREMLSIPCRTVDYAQDAIVATIKTSQPHMQTARQVFTPSGPLAFLPLADAYHCSIVWSLDKPLARQMMALPKAQFEAKLAAVMDGVMGFCQLTTERQSFPLNGRYAKSFVSGSCILVGDAAHAIHPLAGQGANLGLMDVFRLLDVIPAHLKQVDPMLLTKIRQCMRKRQADAVENLLAMQFFKDGFSVENGAFKWLRGFALNRVEQLPLLRQKLIQRALGGDENLPKICLNWMD